MTTFFLRRILQTIPVILAITLVTFILLSKTPGNQLLAIVGERTDEGTMKALSDEYGLDEPVLSQYWRYLVALSRFELGTSIRTRRKVSAELLERFPNTVKLAVASVVVATVMGILIGVISAVYNNTILDRGLMLVSVFAISTPVFWFGLMAIYIFSRLLGWFPPSGIRPYPPGTFWDALPYLVLPCLTLGLRSAAYIAQVTRSTMIEVLREDYIRTARAKGAGAARVLVHGFKNAMIPVLTLVGLDLASYLNGSVITETIFGWPGVGKYVMDGILQRDYPVVMGGVLMGAILFVLLNLLVDLMYGIIDPRIRQGNEEGAI